MLLIIRGVVYVPSKSPIQSDIFGSNYFISGNYQRTRKRCEPENDISGEHPARSFGECHNICQQNIVWQVRK